MSEKQLKSILNFVIYNEFGKINFEGETDLTYVNLDEIVDISENYVTIN